jgi:hypothetical protein
MAMRDTGLNVLRRVGKPAELLDAADGALIVVLPYGGRILGLFAPGDEENFLWAHPALESDHTARAFFASDQWHNSGGDRTWLAPEADFFLPKFPDTSVYHQPRQLDPGGYECRRRPGAIALENRLALRSSRTKQEVTLRIVRSVEPAANPLRDERPPAALGDLEFGGYALHTSLEILEGNAGNGVGLWSLLQLPQGGEMLIPTWSRAEPRVYFGQIPAGDLTVEERLIRYALRAKGEQKIGVRALAATGRVGYLRSSGAKATLVVRNFTVNPSGLYADAPWDAPADLGYAVQACNVNSRWGAFGELEYHVPAIGGPSGLTRCEDTSQVWAFRGGPEPIRALAHLLLGT